MPPASPHETAPAGVVYALRHLPAHLREGRLWDVLCDVLTDFDFLQAKIGADRPPPASSPAAAGVFDLLLDFHETLAALPSDHLQWAALAAERLALNGHPLAVKADPSILVQELFNALQWEWNTTTRLGQRVRTAVEGYGRPFWLRRLNRPWVARDPALRRRLEGHTAMVTSVALTGDGRTVVSGSRDQTVRVWNAESGTLLAWMPCADTILAACVDTTAAQPRIYVADAGGAARIPNLYVLELARTGRS